MRVRHVKVDRFGPLAQESLEFPAGLTVVVGGNESGKSSWHAALYAGLCGMRRGRGKPRAEDVAFEYRHAPWSGDSWSVQVECELGDGRELQLAQDLQAKTASAVDLVTGDDFANELLYEGAPDGSRLLGLDRRVFARTAWVRQAEVMSVREEPEALQVMLQTAASSSEVTATDALRNIAEFRQLQVGVDRANAVRPLRRASEDLAKAVSELDLATLSHHEARSAEARLAAFDEEIAVLECSRDRLFNSGKAFEHHQACERIKYLEGLQGKFPEGEPVEQDDDHGRYLRVLEALGQWKATGDVEDHHEPTAEQIKMRLDDISRERDTERQRDAHIRAAMALLGDHNDDSVSRRKSRPRALLLFGGFAMVLLALKWPLLLVAAAVLWATALLTQRKANPSNVVEGVSERVENLLVGFELPIGSLQQRFEAFTEMMAAEELTRKHLTSELETQLVRVLRSEARRAQEQIVRYEARDALSAAVRMVGASSQDDGRQDVELLGVWCARYIEQTRLTEIRSEQWRRLQIEIEQTPIGDLEARRDHLKIFLNDYEGDMQGVSTDELRLADIEIARARESRAKLNGNLSSKLSMPSVSEAEVTVAEAERELARIQRLDRTLGATAEILLQAEQAAYRTVAPRIQERLTALVSEATNGRYRRLTVNPEDLQIRVESAPGEWRDAQQLSHGTVELVYLLLRIVLVEQLCVTGEQAPLFLDDVTVHFDDQRTVDFLELLHKLSVDRQVVLFSQEEAVAAWAKESLAGNHILNIAI